MPFGFSSFSKNLSKNKLDLNDYVVTNPPSTFFVRYQGENLPSIGVFGEDLLTIDRSLEPKEGSLVLVYFDNTFFIRVLRKERLGLKLIHPVSGVCEEDFITDSIIWGTLTYVIHKAKR